MQNTKILITQEIKDLIMSKTYVEDGIIYLSLENSRLDFSKRFIFRGFTKHSIKLSENTGSDNIHVLAFVDKYENGYKIHAQGWNYSLHIAQRREW